MAAASRGRPSRALASASRRAPATSAPTSRVASAGISWSPVGLDFAVQAVHVTNQSLLLGVGLRQSLGGRLSFYGELFYDVMQGQYSPYPKGFPGMRFGLATGF